MLVAGSVTYFLYGSCYRVETFFAEEENGGSVNDRPLFSTNIGGLFYAALKITEDGEAGWSWPLYPLDSSLITCSAHLVIKMKA